MQLKPVILLQPYNTCRSFTRSGSIYPPLGLCQIAAVDNENVMQVIDADGLGLPDDIIQNEILHSDVRVCCLSATSYNLDIVEKWAEFCHSRGIVTIVGGPHPTLAPKDTFAQCPHVDYIVRGEGEMVINELLAMILLNQDLVGLPGVCYNHPNSPIFSEHILRVTDFSNLPFPKVDSLPITQYYCPDAISFPMLTFSIQRGCPNGCKFCSTSNMSGRKIRGWKLEQIIHEIEFLYFDLGIRELSFVDDVFTFDQRKITALCSTLISKKIQLNWFCNVRANQINETLCKLMRKAGCHQVYVGFESGNQAILDEVGKNEKIAELVNAANILQKAGIDRSVGFVIGLPGETEETVKQTIELAVRTKPERIQFTRFTPLVGSEYANLQKTSLNGFHDYGIKDEVGQWIEMAYAACKNEIWGKKSI